MSQSSSSSQKAFYYDQSAKLSSIELQTLQNIQSSLTAGKKVRDLLNNSLIDAKMIKGYEAELQKIIDRLEKLKIKNTQNALNLKSDDSFSASIETIHTNILEAMKLFNLALGNTDEINWIRQNGQIAEKDARDINMNKNIFFDNIEHCRQFLNEAENTATDLGVEDGSHQNPNEKAV